LEDSDIPEKAVGFVYVITNKVNGKKYIGRKLLTSTTRKPPKEGETRRKKVVKESTWRTYYGSSEEMKAAVKEYGKANFSREIIRFYNSKSSLAYGEAKLIFDTDALIRDCYVNRWITARINSKNLRELYY
jgi:hypothetical protein